MSWTHTDAHYLSWNEGPASFDRVDKKGQKERTSTGIALRQSRLLGEVSGWAETSRLAERLIYTRIVHEA